jgi:hypothetical protein
LVKHSVFALLPKVRHLHNVARVEAVWDVGKRRIRGKDRNET